MRIAVLTDTWRPQGNGVVTALTALVGELESTGHDVCVIHPDRFITVACPTYREIRLAAAPLPGVARRLHPYSGHGALYRDGARRAPANGYAPSIR